MRRVLAVLFLAAAACSRASAGPAWPKMTERETDGGESLAPRASAVAIAASSDDDDAKPAAVPEKPAEAAKPAETTKPASTAPAQAPEEIVITTEEIVIEIED